MTSESLSGKVVVWEESAENLTNALVLLSAPVSRGQLFLIVV